MPNYGTTSITVTGPQADRAALCAALDATSYGKLAFSLSKIAPDIWRGDSLIRVAEMMHTDDALRLHVCQVYDGDCLELAPSLSRRYPNLRFEVWFDCEGDWPNFTMSTHAGGAEIHCAHFEITHLASLVTDPAEPRCRSAVAFYQQMPERDPGAALSLGDCLDLLTRRPDAVAGWRRSDDDATSAVYLMPDADEAGHLVLALDMIQASASLLRNVDPYGGYQSVEPLSLDQVRERLPELIPEIDRLVLETAAGRQQHQDRLANGFLGLDDSTIPF